MTRAVLIVIDLLNDFFERSEVLARKRQEIVAATNSLSKRFRAAGLPVFWVRQEFQPDLSDASLEVRRKRISINIAGTAGCALLPELVQSPDDVVLVKKRYSAFFGTDLEGRLAALRPEVLVLAGVNTHACVRTTAIDAYQRDLETVIASECVAANDEEHHRITVKYLDGKIARFLTNGEIFRELKLNSP